MHSRLLALPYWILIVIASTAPQINGFTPLGATPAYLASLSSPLPTTTSQEVSTAALVADHGIDGMVVAPPFYEAQIKEELFHNHHQEEEEIMDYYGGSLYDNAADQFEYHNDEEEEQQQQIEEDIINPDDVNDYYGFQADIRDYLYWVALYETNFDEVIENPLIEYAEGDEELEEYYYNREHKDEQYHEVCQNVLGTMLRPCTDGNGADAFCTIQEEEEPLVVCCQLTDDFLESDHGWYLREFGLAVDDVGCISVDHWIDAYNDGVAPPLFLEATHSQALEEIDIDFLRAYALDHDVALERLQELQITKAKLSELIRRKDDDDDDHRDT